MTGLTSFNSIEGNTSKQVARTIFAEENLNCKSVNVTILTAVWKLLQVDILVSFFSGMTFTYLQLLLMKIVISKKEKK